MSDAAGRSPALHRSAVAALLAWYDATGRDLPFRQTTDPYAILVSEVMAQQTQIGRVSVAWQTWLSRFPSIEALASATPADVLRAWQGLGYNRRGLNLWRAAIVIRDEHDGALPRDVAALERLPGVGPYTARAVAAIAFGAAVAPVDTNVRRVLSRALGIDPERTRVAELQAIGDASISPDRPGDWTHAAMDLGATVCRPATPDCASCPIRRWCATAATASPASIGSVVGRGRRAERFTETTRWLRGRIVDELRAAAGDGWVRLGDAIGSHDPAAVRAALAALARDGIVELRRGSDDTARLPLA